MNSSEQSESVGDTLHAIIGYEEDGLRLDKAVATLLPDFSRTRLQGLIESGECLVDGQPCLSASRKVKAGEQIVLSLPPLEDATPEPENIPLEIFFEDEDVIVLNKPVGMVVHPAIGHATGTLVNALLYHCGDSLSGINGVRRPGIVHRLDKDTSGLMMVAKNDLAHHHLSEQLQDRSLSRVYQALVFGVPFPHKGRVETLIGRHPSNRLKMAVVKGNGKEAATNFTVLENYNDALALVECRLETGRTHQIRVHMQHLGFPLAGDELYGVQSNKAKSILRKGGYEDDVIDAVMSFPRQALHAAEISFIHPKTEEEMHFTSPLPDDLFRLLEML